MSWVMMDSALAARNRCSSEKELFFASGAPATEAASVRSAFEMNLFLSSVCSTA
jgi:hypothetical protein